MTSYGNTEAGFGRREACWWIYRFVPLRNGEGDIVSPHSVVAPESALGSVPTVALSSAQVKGIVGARKWLLNWINQRGEQKSETSARLFDRSCLVATQDPSR